MRYFRRLPPLLCVVSLLGLLFLLAAFALGVFGLVTNHLSSSPSFPQSSIRVQDIAGNLGLLGLACTFAVQTYSTRFRLPDRGAFPLSSWQSRTRVIAVVAALSICSLVLAVVIPPTAGAFVIVFLSQLGAIVLLVVALVATLAVNIGG